MYQLVIKLHLIVMIVCMYMADFSKPMQIVTRIILCTATIKANQQGLVNENLKFSFACVSIYV